jgi:hypothetical protein
LQRTGPGNRDPGQVLGADADGHLDTQILARAVVRERDGDQVGVGDLPAALGDQAQRANCAVALPGGQELTGDRRGGLQPLAPRAGGGVQAGVVDRRRGRRGERGGERLVLGAELPARALGEVEVAEDLVPDADRHPEEAVHGWMARREARRARVVADAAQPDRPRVVDQRAEQSLALREVRDPADDDVGHPGVDELRQASGR